MAPPRYKVSGPMPVSSGQDLLLVRRLPRPAASTDLGAYAPVGHAGRQVPRPPQQGAATHASPGPHSALEEQIGPHPTGAMAQNPPPPVVVPQKRLGSVWLHGTNPEHASVPAGHTDGGSVVVVVVVVGAAVVVVVVVGATVHRAARPGPAPGVHTKPSQHTWFPSQGWPASRHFGAAAVSVAARDAPMPPANAAPRILSTRRRDAPSASVRVIPSNLSSSIPVFPFTVPLGPTVGARVWPGRGVREARLRGPDLAASVFRSRNLVQQPV